MEFTTNRLILRSFTGADVDALYAIKYDPMVLKYNPDFIQRDATREQVALFVTELEAAERGNDYRRKHLYAVVLRDTGEVIGALTFVQNNMLREYEVGWKIRTEFTRKGYASEAAAALCEYMCELLALDYVIVVMDTDNPASFRTAEKSGFRLFEKRKVYDHSYSNFGDDYYYFRRYQNKSETTEKFYGDAEFTGRGARAEDERHDKKLIILRGNSGSGKSTIARKLQKRLGRGTLYIPQDVVRREMLWVRDDSGNMAVPMLQELIKFGNRNCEYTILEGILYSPDYQDVFRTAKETYGTKVFSYYFDLPFEETLARHKTKPNRDEFGEKEMAEWFVERDLMGLLPEEFITKEESEDDIVKRILSDVMTNGSGYV